MSAGQNSTCARKRNNTLYCWGSLDSGVLAMGDLMPRTTPSRVPSFEDWLQVSTETFHTCGLRQNGEIWCAGRNTEGQLTGSNLQDAVPSMQRMGSDSDWVEVRAGRFFTCARKRNDSIWCTGDNDDGEISSDSSVDRSNVLLELTL
ncbi:MAG: RCC1 domain-containing protein [Myxococcota bacterium]